jgi:hypothetical protein
MVWVSPFCLPIFADVSMFTRNFYPFSRCKLWSTDNGCGCFLFTICWPYNILTFFPNLWLSNQHTLVNLNDSLRLLRPLPSAQRLLHQHSQPTQNNLKALTVTNLISQLVYKMYSHFVFTFDVHIANLWLCWNMIFDSRMLRSSLCGYLSVGWEWGS